MGLTDRPFIGTYQLNNQQLVQHTPDGFVYLNGDTSLPGCPTCNGRINVQQYVTQISVDAGVDPAAAQANFSLAVPLHTPDNFAYNAQFLLRPGLEVHIYFRGYFPIAGLYKSVSPEELGGIDITRLPAYPYYHVFHGVVTSVSHSFSGGFQDISITCASMLHFWQYHNISTNASAFGTRPVNSKLKTSLVGHNMTGFTPFSILYTLVHDTAGAAGGVAFALGSKTNVNSTSTVTNDSLFSLNIRYWEERFRSRMFNLRMHGASGQLFSTAQAAFLGRLKGGAVRDLLDQQWRVKTGANRTKKFDLLSAAQELNFLREVVDPATGERTIQGIDVIEAERQADPSSAKANPGSGYEVNVAAMQAFVSDLGNWGQVNLFESTYETKLDIANKVTEITGWEFYQDVDGDFVFKPKLFNLDTRGSRAYLIKDIDVISFTQTSSEPQATYVTMTGSQFKNLKGTGLEGEWGVRGQYIDYKLVAQYGWRPNSFETSYFNNPRSMFFAAVNRLDVLNAGIEAGNCSIPIRPELRPGYPVYVEYLDCFYYVESMNHQLAFGSQSTTTLTLTAKRAAFYAPGRPQRRLVSPNTALNTATFEETGIASIDFSNTRLPRRPLTVIDELGHPRQPGFPNVVLALDVNAVNPLFFAAGLDLDRIDNPQVLRNVIRAAQEYSLVSVSEDGQRITIHVTDEQDAQIDPTGAQSQNAERDNTPVQRDARTFTFDELVAVSRTYTALQTAPSSKAEANGELINQKNAKITQLNGRDSSLAKQDQNDPKVISQRAQIRSELQKLSTEIQTLSAEVRSEALALEQQLQFNPDIQVLIGLLREVGDRFLAKTDDRSQPSETAALLDLLSDKKAIFSNGSLPGSYRYFSSAHPDQSQQATRNLDTTLGLGGGEGSSFFELATPRTVPAYQSFVTKEGAGGFLPEAELGTQTVTVGFPIAAASAIINRSTDQIQTLSFQQHDFRNVTQQTTYEYGEFFDGIDAAARSRIRAAFPSTIFFLDLPISQAYSDVWDQFTAPLRGTSLGGEGLDFPETINFKGNTIETTVVTAEQFQQRFFPTDETYNTTVGALNGVLSTLLISRIGGFLRAGWVRVDSTEDNGLRNERAREFSRVLKAATQGKGRFKLGKRVKKPKPKRTFAYSPVFPVSDEGGYEVVGSYRYGRGLRITPASTFEELTNLDPLQFADRQAVEDFVDVLQGNSPSGIGTVDEGNNRVAVGSPNVVRDAVERQLVESILSNPAAPPELIEQLNDPDLQTSTGLRNFIARNNEGVERLPVNNAAFTLGDLSSFVDNQPCTCRAAEADILMEAFSTDNIVEVVVPGNLDQVSKFVQGLNVERSLTWRRNRDAIAGTRPSRRESNFREALRGFRSQLDNFNAPGSSTRAALDALNNAAEGVVVAARDVRGGGQGENFVPASQQERAARDAIRNNTLQQDVFGDALPGADRDGR